MVSGPVRVRRPRLILRKSAWVTIRLAGAFVYGGCSRPSSSPRKRASIGTGSTLRPRGAAARLLGEVVGVVAAPSRSAPACARRRKSMTSGPRSMKVSRRTFGTTSPTIESR